MSCHIPGVFIFMLACHNKSEEHSIRFQKYVHGIPLRDIYSLLQAALHCVAIDALSVLKSVNVALLATIAKVKHA